MQKVAIMALRSRKEDLLQALQELGVLEISEATQPPAVDHTEVKYREAEVQFAIATLKDFASKETLSTAGKPAKPEDVLAAALHTDVRGIVDLLHTLEEEDTAAERRITELLGTMDVLRPWRGLPYALDAATETAHTVRLLGFVPETNLAAFERLDDASKINVQRVNDGESPAAFAVTVWKTDRDMFEEAATALGWTTVTLPAHAGTPAELYEELAVEEKKLRALKQQNREKRRQISVELPNLLKAKLFLGWLDAKQAAREAIMETSATVTLLGWVPRAGVGALESRLERVVSAAAVMKVKPDEGEEPPILLRNNKLITPFESVTTLYGYPTPSDMDPTSALAPFFALYFAICLTDGGYGLVLTAIFGAYLFLTKKSVEEARLPWLLFISGIASILVGIPFGGWFGLSPDQVPAFLTRTDAEGTRWFLGQVWNLGTQEGINFLQYLALFLGITHIFFGIFLAGFHKWVHGAKAEAFWQHFTLHLLLGAAIFKAVAPETMATIATYTLYGIIALTIWGKGYGSPWYIRPLMGVLGLVNFGIGLLSNGLSYLRLLALGLVTGAIALAVNQVAIEMSRLFPIWLAIPVMILIAVCGHLVSVALNALGSFIHSGRLQFIEFFGQFFEGGGRPYAPFKRSLL